VGVRDAVATPEPASWLLLAFGAGMAVRARRRARPAKG
jgi:hypothetical protein